MTNTETKTELNPMGEITEVVYAVAFVSIAVNLALLSYLMLYSGSPSFTAIHFLHRIAAPLFASMAGGAIGAYILSRG